MTPTRLVGRTRSVEVLTGGVVLALGVIPMLAFLFIEPDYLLSGSDEVVDAIRAEGTTAAYRRSLVLHTVGLTCLAAGTVVVGRGLGRAGRPLAGALGAAAGVSAAVAAALLVLAYAVPAVTADRRAERRGAHAASLLDVLSVEVVRAGFSAFMVCLLLLALAWAITRAVHPGWAGVPGAAAFITLAAVQSGDGLNPLLVVLFQAALAVASLIAGAVGVQHPLAAGDAPTAT